MPKKPLPFLLFIALAALLPVAETPAQDADFKVIANADVTVDSMAEKQLSKIFLKKVKRWEDDSNATVFDLESGSEVREAFTRAVHGKSVSAIKSYWQRMIFSGRDVAPDELTSDDEMIEKVASTPGGVGYVSASATLPDGVKVLEVSK